MTFEDQLLAAMQRAVDVALSDGPWMFAADSVRVAFAAVDGEPWAVRELTINPAWQLDVDGELPTSGDAA